MIRFSVLWAYKAKTSSEAICETVGKALWVECPKNLKMFKLDLT